MVETGFIPKYQTELIPAAQPAPSHFVALAALSVLLKEGDTGAPLDPFSPWDRPTSFRLNYTPTRTLRFIDPALAVQAETATATTTKQKKTPGEIPVQVITHENGWYGLSIGGNNYQAKGKYNEGTLDAHVGDTFYSGVRVVEYDSEIYVFHQGTTYTFTRPVAVAAHSGTGDAHTGQLLSPMPGKIVKVNVKVGDKVAKGTQLVIMEAMKMEHTIRAPTAGVVESVRFGVGEIVEEKKVLVTLKPL